MNDRELKHLQHNLTRSAKKAKKYWVRGMIGFQESEQGFFPIGDIPIINPFTEKETRLDDFNKDVDTEIKKLVQVNKDLNIKLDEMNDKYRKVLDEIEELKHIYSNMDKNYTEILEKGLAEYIKVLANL
jgi:hypothetical protein